MPELDGIVGISRFKEIAAAVEAVVKGQKVAWISDPPSSFIESGRRLLSTLTAWHIENSRRVQQPLRLLYYTSIGVDFDPNL